MENHLPFLSDRGAIHGVVFSYFMQVDRRIPAGLMAIRKSKVTGYHNFQVEYD